MMPTVSMAAGERARAGWADMARKTPEGGCATWAGGGGTVNGRAVRWIWRFARKERMDPMSSGEAGRKVRKIHRRGTETDLMSAYARSGRHSSSASLRLCGFSFLADGPHAKR